MIIVLLMCSMFKGVFWCSEVFFSSQIRLWLSERCLHFHYYSQKISPLPFSFILARVWKFMSLIRRKKSWMNRNERNFSFVRIFSSTHALCVLWLIHKITEISDVTWAVKWMNSIHLFMWPENVSHMSSFSIASAENDYMMMMILRFSLIFLDFFILPIGKKFLKGWRVPAWLPLSKHSVKVVTWV